MQDLSKITLDELKAILAKQDNANLYIIMVDHKDRWNQLLEENNGQLRIKGIKLIKKDLKGLDLSNLVIEESDFSDSDLSGSKLDNSIISHTTFQGTKMYHSTLNGARISETNMSRASLYEQDIKGANFTGSVNLFEAYLKKEDGEEHYRTHPSITKRGFRMAEAYEHADDDGHGGY